AVADYVEAIRLDPTGAAGYHNRGLAHAARKEYERAIADRDEALRLDPERAIVPDQQRLIYTGLSAGDAASFELGAGPGQGPAYADAYYLRGNIRLNRHQFDQAIADYTVALGFHPEHAPALTNRGAAHAAKREYADAREDFTALTHLDPNSTDAYIRLGV